MGRGFDINGGIVSDALVASLVEFYTPEQIRGFWKQTADARMARVAVNIHINSTTFEGQTGAGMTLSTLAEQDDFIQACRAALAEKEGTPLVSSRSLGVGVDFSQSCVSA